MKVFVIKLFIFLLVVLSVVTLFLVNFTNGHIDARYHCFTYQAGSLIVGSSRAAVGLSPDEILGREVGKNYAKPFLNFAINKEESPYGPAYFEAIKKKVKKGDQKGVFIVSVDPWSLSISESAELNKFREDGKILTSMKFFNMKPNVEYLFLHCNIPFYRILINRNGTESGGNQHLNGWHEINTSMDSSSIAIRSADRMAHYSQLNDYVLSEKRIESLINILEYLKGLGDVYIVRLPISQKLLELENKFFPKFHERISTISEGEKVRYLDLTPFVARYETWDGDHLINYSARELSQELGKRLNYKQ